MKTRSLIALVVAGIVLITGLIAAISCAGYCPDTHWQIVQSVSGVVKVHDKSGWYYKGFATVWEYPRAYITVYSVKDEADTGTKADPVGITFNDAGTAKIGAIIRFATPTSDEKRRLFHRDFSGRMENCRMSIKAYLVQCCKATSPLMSSSEHQSARKSEFANLVENQLVGGLYRMRRIRKEVPGMFDDQGKPLMVDATDIILDEDGLPLIERTSPLAEYDIIVRQFSIMDTDYDPETRKQFAAKKDAFLAAEKSKAQQEQEFQQRLMVVERGLREKAEAEATANVAKAKATIAAELKVAVEQQAKLEAETKANKALAVAQIEKEEAETRANRDLEVARIEAQAALERKKAIIAIAEGREKAIILSGAMTELQGYQIDAEVKKAQVVAEALAQIRVPGVMFMGGAGDGGAGGDALTTNLINLKLLEATGILDMTNVRRTNVAARPNNNPGNN